MTTIRRIIGEIEEYLASPMRNKRDYWEWRERGVLSALVTLLKAQRDVMNAAQ
jgi:hypothetical protein